MPIYEFSCEKCGHLFESLLKIGGAYPSCPTCGSANVIKVPSTFAFKDVSHPKAERERSILSRARDYLIDGKFSEAKGFLDKAKDYCPTDRIKKLSDTLAERKPKGGYFVSKTEAMIIKNKER